MTTPAAFAQILKEVGRALVALAPYREEIILVGGIVPVLYRELPRFFHPEHPPLATTEADLALPPRLPVKGKSIVELLFDAGFVVYEAPGLSRKKPGKQFFQDKSNGTERAAPTYLEFLAPMIGRPREGFIEPQHGVRAPPLRYLDLVSHEAMVMDAQQVSPLGVTVACPVRVPHPAMYVLQKVLARTSGRSPSKQPKDMAYAFDVAVLTQPVWSELGAVVASARTKKPEWSAWVARGVRDLDRLFKTETSDGVIEAARMYKSAMTSGAPSERAVFTAMRGFIDALSPK